MSLSTTPDLLASIRQLLNESRDQLIRTVNNVMVKTYWEVGRLIVEDEQQGEKKAAYGQSQIKALSEDLRKEFGKGFTARNLLICEHFICNIQFGTQ